MKFEELRTLKECIIDIESTVLSIVEDGNKNKYVYAYLLGKQVARAHDIIVKSYHDAESASRVDSKEREEDI